MRPARWRGRLTVLQIARLDASAVARAADEIGRLAAEDDGVAAIVVGLPRRLDGSPTNLTAGVQAFASQLGARTGLPVAFQDERLTSVEAESRAGRARQGLAVAQEAARRGCGRHHPAGSSRRFGQVRRLFLRLLPGGGGARAIGAAGAGGYVLWTRMHQPFQAFAGEQFVEIPSGAGPRAIARRLADAGVVPDTWTLPRRGARGRAAAASCRPASIASPSRRRRSTIVERLPRGDVYTVAITFPEGLTIDEMADLFAARGLGTARVVSRGGARRQRHCGSRSGGARSRGLSVSRDLPGVAPRGRDDAGRDDGRAFQDGVRRS